MLLFFNINIEVKSRNDNLPLCFLIVSLKKIFLVVSITWSFFLLIMSGIAMDIESTKNEEKPEEIHESVSCNLNGAVCSIYISISLDPSVLSF